MSDTVKIRSDNGKTDEITIVIPPVHHNSNVEIAAENVRSDAARQEKVSGFRKFTAFLNFKRTVADEQIKLPDSCRIDKVTAVKDPHPELSDLSSFFAVESQPFASGGQGSISRGEDRALGCTVAIKSLHKKHCSDPLNRRNFINEACLTAALDHPAIIPVHGLFGDGQDGLHLAMKLVDGCTLSEYMKQLNDIYTRHGIQRYNERKSLRNRLEIFLRVCDAVSCAHDRNIIHRDLKCENIMLGKYKAVYVTDWGIACREADAAKLEKVSGTPGYIAPELLTEKRADRRSDIYSLGIILFELTTLKSAFADEPLNILLAKVQRGMHQELKHKFACAIDPNLAAIIRRAIHLDPAKRYQTVQDLSRDLRKYLANEAVSARKESFLEKFARWGVNHRRGMMITVLAVLLLGSSSTVYTLQKEIRSGIAEQRRTAAINHIQTNIAALSSSMEKRIRHIEYQMDALRMNILFSLFAAVPEPVKQTQLNYVEKESYKNSPPATYLMSPVYGSRIDSSSWCYFNYLHKSVSAQELQKFTPVALFMQKMLLGTVDTEQIKRFGNQALLNGTQPAKLVMAALQNGLFVCYPGNGDFPENYDPTTRPWYKQAVANPNEVQWVTPYNDVGSNNELVTTCALAINDNNGKLIGVAAMDFSLNRLSREMLSAGIKYNQFVREKMLINQHGRIFLKSTESPRRYSWLQSTPELIQQMLAMQHGTLSVKHDGEEHLLAFSLLKSVQMLYVEDIDLPALLNSTDSAEQP